MSLNDLNLKQTDAIEDDDYQRPEERKSIPDDGNYTFELPIEFPDDAFGSTARQGSGEEGYLRVQIDPTITFTDDGEETEHAGYVLRYQRVSARPYPWRNSTEIHDLAVGLGHTPSEVPTDPMELVNWIRENWAEESFPAHARWEYYRADELGPGKALKINGQRNFTPENLKKLGVPIEVTDENRRVPQAPFPSPTEKDEGTGEPKMRWPNFRINRVIVPKDDE